MDSKTKDALKQLQGEIHQLQALMAAGGAAPKTDDEPAAKKGRSPALVEYSVHYAPPGSPPDGPKPRSYSFTELQINSVEDNAAASVGYALASPQKIGLLRALLGKDSESAAALGEATSLSTGSLYHHLRELMRADLVTQSGRNRYVLTGLGAHALLLLLALAAEGAGRERR